LHLQIFGPLMVGRAPMKVVEQELTISSSNSGEDNVMVLVSGMFLTRGAYHFRVVLVKNNSIPLKEMTCTAGDGSERCRAQPESEDANAERGSPDFDHAAFRAEHDMDTADNNRTGGNSTNQTQNDAKIQTKNKFQNESKNSSNAANNVTECWTPLTEQVLLCSTLDHTPLRGGGTCRCPGCGGQGQGQGQGQTGTQTQGVMKSRGVVVERVVVTAHGVGGVPWCMQDARELSYCADGRVMCDVQYLHQLEAARQERSQVSGERQRAQSEGGPRSQPPAVLSLVSPGALHPLPSCLHPEPSPLTLRPTP
jgi:hypothetical protein